MISFKRTFLFLSLSAFILGCQTGKDSGPDPEKGKVLARVGHEYLYFRDIAHLIEPGISSEDSAAVVNRSVSSWIKEMLVVERAENELSEEKAEIDRQLADNRKALLSHEYEKKILREKLDTNISNTEIEKYYQQNSRNFELKKNIIKVNYVKVSKKAPDLNKVKLWYKSSKPEDKALLEKYSAQHSENYFLDDNAWLYFDDLLKEIPIQTYNTELFLQNNRFVEVADSAYLYFLNIKGFKIKNSISPLAFEKNNIKNIILNKRKLSVLQKIREEMYSNAKESNEFEVYKN